MLAKKLVFVGYTVALVVMSFVSSNASAASKEVIEFRLAKWKSAHFNSEKDSQTVVDTLKQLGCEASKHAHDGHTDVTYRCVTWKTISAKTHDEAHKWEKWLQAYGFETKHVH